MFMCPGKIRIKGSSKLSMLKLSGAHCIVFPLKMASSRKATSGKGSVGNGNATFYVNFSSVYKLPK